MSTGLVLLAQERRSDKTTDHARVLTPALVTTYQVDYPQPIRRRVKGALTLIGASAAAVIALAAGSPAASADPSTVVLPGLPVFEGPETSPESLGVAPFSSGETYLQNGTFTDLFNETRDTTATYYEGGPLQVDTYSLPGLNPSITTLPVTDPGGGYGIEGHGLEGDVGSSTFSAILTSAGFYNLYEETPYYAIGASTPTESINDVLLFDPTADPLLGLSGVEFGIQYLDLPDAANPVDEINLQGQAGEILFSIPVTGDLAERFLSKAVAGSAPTRRSPGGWICALGSFDPTIRKKLAFLKKLFGLELPVVGRARYGIAKEGPIVNCTNI